MDNQSRNPSPGATSLKRKSMDGSHPHPSRPPPPPTKSEYKSGQVNCAVCGSNVSFRDAHSGEFTLAHWDQHRLHCASTSSSSQTPPPPSASHHHQQPPHPQQPPQPQPSIPIRTISPTKHRRAKRTEEERINYLRADPYVAQLEAYRVLCASCNKWIRLRPNSTYCSIPWDAHRKSCLSKKMSITTGPKSSPSSPSALEERNALFSQDPTVRKFDAERILCNVCDRWISLSPEDHQQAVLYWRQHRASCVLSGTKPVGVGVGGGLYSHERFRQVYQSADRSQHKFESVPPPPEQQHAHTSLPLTSRHGHGHPSPFTSTNTSAVYKPPTPIPPTHATTNTVPNPKPPTPNPPTRSTSTTLKPPTPNHPHRSSSSATLKPPTPNPPSRSSPSFTSTKPPTPNPPPSSTPHPHSRPQSPLPHYHPFSPPPPQHPPQHPTPFPSSPYDARRRNADQRAAALRADRLITDVQPNKVFCSLCRKWVQLRQDSSYCAYPWLQHRGKCLARHERRRHKMVEHRDGGAESANDAGSESYPESEEGVESNLSNELEGPSHHHQVYKRQRRDEEDAWREVGTGTGDGGMRRTGRQHLRSTRPLHPTNLADLDSSSGRRKFIYASIDYLFMTTYESCDDMTISALLTFLNAAMPPDKHEDFDTTEVVKAAASLQEEGRIKFEGDMLKLLE